MNVCSCCVIIRISEILAMVGRMSESNDVTVALGKNIAKSNALVRGIYKGMTVWDYRLFHMCLSQIIYDEAIDEDKLYYLSAVDVAAITKTDVRSVYRKMIAAGNNLVRSVVTIKEMPDGSSRQDFGYEDDISLFQRCRYHHKKGIIGLQFTRAIMPYISELNGRYTLTQLIAMARLKSAYSMRIYELCLQWPEKPSQEFELAELRELLDIDDRIYLRFDSFKDRVIKPVIRDLNRYTDLCISYTQRKKGKRVTHIRFHYDVLTKKQIERRLELYPEDHSIHIDRSHMNKKNEPMRSIDALED